MFYAGASGTEYLVVSLILKESDNVTTPTRLMMRVNVPKTALYTFALRYKVSSSIHWTIHWNVQWWPPYTKKKHLQLICSFCKGSTGGPKLSAFSISQNWLARPVLLWRGFCNYSIINSYLVSTILWWNVWSAGQFWLLERAVSFKGLQFITEKSHISFSFLSLKS